MAGCPWQTRPRRAGAGLVLQVHHWQGLCGQGRSTQLTALGSPPGRSTEVTLGIPPAPAAHPLLPFSTRDSSRPLPSGRPPSLEGKTEGSPAWAVELEGGSGSYRPVLCPLAGTHRSLRGQVLSSYFNFFFLEALPLRETLTSLWGAHQDFYHPDCQEILP